MAVAVCSASDVATDRVHRQKLVRMKRAGGLVRLNDQPTNRTLHNHGSDGIRFKFVGMSRAAPQYHLYQCTYKGCTVTRITPCQEEMKAVLAIPGLGSGKVRCKVCHG